MIFSVFNPIFLLNFLAARVLALLNVQHACCYVLEIVNDSYVRAELLRLLKFFKATLLERAVLGKYRNKGTLPWTRFAPFSINQFCKVRHDGTRGTN